MRWRVGGCKRATRESTHLSMRPLHKVSASRHTKRKSRNHRCADIQYLVAVARSGVILAQGDGFEYVHRFGADKNAMSRVFRRVRTFDSPFIELQSTTLLRQGHPQSLVTGATGKLSTPGLRNCENGDCIVGSSARYKVYTRVERTRCANHTSLHTRVQLLL